MTLFKQLALLLSLFLLIILTTVTVQNFTSTIENAEQQLYSDAQNTAASLSLSLAAANGDESTMATMINANFDSGHYRWIVLKNRNEEVIHERVRDDCSPDVPEWFVDLVGIDVPVAAAPVSSGWMVIGTLSVEGDDSHTYLMLYNSFKQLLGSFAFFTLASLTALHLLLYTILAPLRLLQKQAEAIGRNEFRYQERLPFTKEFREIVVTMNAMVKKAENSFKTGSRAVEQNRRLLYTEKLPRLYNEHYLMLTCQEELMGSGEYDGGVVVIAEFSGLEIAESQLGREGAEELLIELATFLIEKASLATKGLVARLSKTRFALLLPGSKEADAAIIVRAVYEGFQKQLEACRLDDCDLLIGSYAFNAEESYQTFMRRAIENIADVKEGLPPQDHHLEPVQFMQSQWEALINAALEKERFSYHVRNVLDASTDTIYDRAITIVMHDEGGKEYPYGRFIAPAVKAHKVLEIYLQVIKLMVQNFTESDKQGRYTFSLAKSLLLEERTFAALQEEFEKFENTHQLDFCIELPESFIADEQAMAKRYVDLIKAHGYRFGIGEFSAESENLAYLEQFRPEFIKISKLYLLDMIAKESPLLASLQTAADSLGIRIIATGVSGEDELAMIKAAGITIVQGYITEVI
ncbi:LapD/MoxY N-terminal periplasmic domain-containing protein [Sulfurimonas sp. HSL3-7]|uniref:bifunctional diguanylate cyclase/phosphodiesterase n=1 Tax=Sulfonitrofixus jiaomeiensis TaxID=3131938 RepID=UPI0031F9C8CC